MKMALLRRIKTEMEKGWTDSSTPFEYRLFHGAADEDTVREICHQNFDPQMHRAHDTPYGKGAYFASTALNGHLNARSAARTGCRYMFFARVLIGQRTNGKGEYRQPPKRSSGARYNSCVDDKDNPTIFVVSDRNQCYPEYVIEYEDLRHPAFNKKPSSSSDAGCSVM